MKKIVLSVLLLALASLALAQDLTVRGDYSLSGDVAVAVEYAHPVGAGNLVLGVSVDPLTFGAEAVFGARSPFAEVDGVVFSLPVLVHLPVYDGQDFILGQVAASVGVEAYVTQPNGFGLVFSAAARSDVDSSIVSTLPDFSVGLGLRYSF